MATEKIVGDIGIATLNVDLNHLQVIDYDRKAMRKALRDGAGIVRKEARRIISRCAISKPGEFPGMQTGALKRAIGIVSRGSKGGWVKVGVRKTKEMKAFYPAFLFYGSAKTGLKPRGNFIVSALNTKRETVRDGIRGALKYSLVAR